MTPKQKREMHISSQPGHMVHDQLAKLLFGRPDLTDEQVAKEAEDLVRGVNIDPDLIRRPKKKGAQPKDQEILPLSKGTSRSFLFSPSLVYDKKYKTNNHKNI